MKKDRYAWMRGKGNPAKRLEVRKKLIAGNYKRWSDPEYKKKMLEINARPDVKKKKSLSLMGNHYALKENASVTALHSWLHRNFGKPYHCESVVCEGKSYHFDWSLLKGKQYERKRENFWQLCRSCHKKYDYTESIHIKMRITRMKNKKI